MKLALDSLLLGVMLVSAAAGFIITFLAYWRVRSKRLLSLWAVMMVFLIKSVILLIPLFISDMDYLSQGNYTVVFDIVIIALILLSGFLE
ncbi:MAG: hypothetical protein R6U61_03515 [Thermoplasmata archaeon]